MIEAIKLPSPSRVATKVRVAVARPLAGRSPTSQVLLPTIPWEAVPETNWRNSGAVLPISNPVAGVALWLVTVIVSVKLPPTVRGVTLEMLTPTSATPKLGAPRVVAAANTSLTLLVSRLSRLSASLVKRIVEPSALMTGW